MRSRRRHLARRFRHQPAQQLLPEDGVGLVGVILQHLPAPRSRRGEHRRAAVSVILNRQKRRGPVARRLHVQQDDRAGLRRSQKSRDQVFSAGRWTGIISAIGVFA